MKKKIIEALYNWHVRPESDLMTRISVGETYETSHGLLKCLSINESSKDGYHIEIEFEDGSVEKQWNINKIVYDGEAK